MLSVKAKDKGTGREQKITITASSGLSKEEVEKMTREAEAHAAEDTKRKEEIEARNVADNLAYNAEKTLRDNKDKIPAELNTELESKIAAVRTALQGNDVEAIKKTTQELSTALQSVGSAVYGKQQEGAPAQEEPSAEGKKADDEGTVEGEFREV
jgi:molecular chaperone DnaK